MSMKEEFTAIDMATAAADGFRAGQRAAQSAGVPDGERLAELLESVRLGDDEAKPHGSGATYWNNAVLACQVAIRDALAAAPTVKAEQAPTPEFVWVRLLEALAGDNGCPFTASTDDYREAKPALVQLIAAGLFRDDADSLDGDIWTIAAGEQSEAAARFASCADAYAVLSDVLNRVFERPDEAPSLPAAGSAVEERMRNAVIYGTSHPEIYKLGGETAQAQGEVQMPREAPVVVATAILGGLFHGGFGPELGEIDIEVRMPALEALQCETVNSSDDVYLPLMTVAQHNRIVAALSAQQSDPWAPSDADYDHAIHRNPDARAWADFFVATFPGQADKHDLMIGWFANAMMAMHDHLKAQQPEFCCKHSYKVAKQAAWGARDLTQCKCDHNEYCEHCWPDDFKEGGKWQNGFEAQQSAPERVSVPVELLERVCWPVVSGSDRHTHSEAVTELRALLASHGRGEA